jgi:hypothetical protein
MLLDKGMNTMPHILCEGPQHRHHLLSSSISLFSLFPYMRSINPNHTWSCLQLKLLSLKLSYPSHQLPFFYCCSLPHNNYTIFMICCNWSINPNHTWSCLKLKLFFLKLSYPSHQLPSFYCCSLPHNNYSTFIICCKCSINPNHTLSCLQLKLFFLIPTPIAFFYIVALFLPTIITFLWYVVTIWYTSNNHYEHFTRTWSHKLGGEGGVLSILKERNTSK